MPFIPSDLKYDRSPVPYGMVAITYGLNPLLYGLSEVLYRQRPIDVSHHPGVVNRGRSNLWRKRLGVRHRSAAVHQHVPDGCLRTSAIQRRPTGVWHPPYALCRKRGNILQRTGTIRHGADARTHRRHALPLGPVDIRQTVPAMWQRPHPKRHRFRNIRHRAANILHIRCNI